ncbi:adenylate/guanylate cyclase [Candidatus Moduliflexus flocculans]|uniref:Adenylate/guanylate cyclase n=1 Tax=Candidatus Moduliflexus flocculans TaxID=1499966 RepID=A0A0S6VZI8_9BACT|nr:adenylate/guanylate cyclase [Candidatus Moduliflexus flocculans]
MHKFSQFDLKLNIGRLPLIYSLGDLTSIREIFTPEDEDVGRTQLPILPPTSGIISLNDEEIEGYLVETSSPLMFTIREFLQGLDSLMEWKQQSGDRQHSDVAENFAALRRDCMNRLGARLVDVIKQERRLGLYNLFWLTISKYLIGLLDRVIAHRTGKQTKRKLEMLPLITQTFLDAIQQVKRYLQKEDAQQRHYSRYIDEMMLSHLGAAFNYEFSRSVITDQIHVMFPQLSRTNLMECAQQVFQQGNEKYHLGYDDFVNIYSGIRTYIDKRLRSKDPMFCEMAANVMKIPSRNVLNIPVEAILFHPGVISIFAEEIRQLPVKSPTRKKLLFKSSMPQLGDLFAEGTWEFALADYLNFAKDLRRSEIITTLRNRLAFFTPSHQSSSHASSAAESAATGIADRISYRFEKGRIIQDLRNVTLIFLDLRGFTELSAGDITDQVLKQYLYKFFDPVVNIINHFNGVIKTYAGDGILASFGNSKYHVLQAIRASIEVKKFFTLLKNEHKIPFTGMGIGIHTGLVEETYFFSDLESPNLNTVIGLSANLVGRLSSGKTEKKIQIEPHSLKELRDYLEAHDPALSAGSGALAIFEDRLQHVVQAIQSQKNQTASEQAEYQKLSVKVLSGVLNNHGIALSNDTFAHLHAIQQLHEQQVAGTVHYTFFDSVLQEELVLIKAGDATFKGLKGKFPVWGIYAHSEFA